MARTLTLILGILTLCVGCLAPTADGPAGGAGAAGPGAPVATQIAAVAATTRPAGATALPVSLAVDTSVVPVSLSRPPADAARAFDLCLIDEWVGRNGAQVIAGLGKIDHATGAYHYAPLTGLEPELKSDDPAWMVQFRGDIRMPMSNTIYVDPTCVVVDGGDGGFFATGGVRQVGSDVVKAPAAVAFAPDRALPPPKP
jgi:hypothetical protein